MSIALTTDRKAIVGVEQRLSPNTSRVFSPRFAVLHYTAGPSAEGALERFAKSDSQVSAHFVIDKQGHIYQCAPLNVAAWHAGESFWKPAQSPGKLLGLKNLNRFSFGIEMVNAGPLRRSQGGAFYTWWGQQVPPNEIVEVEPGEAGSFNRRYWARYPEEQIASAIELVSLLVHEFKLEEILGHSDIAPGRKQDPGPAFPMRHIRSVIQGRNS